MKTTQPLIVRQPRLFKSELKFMDFWHVTNDYLKTTLLDEEVKKELMIRINDYSIQMHNTIALYPMKNKKANKETYDAITSGLKESVRRAKISMALNQSHLEPFGAYWKFLVGILKNDTALLKDEHLQNAITHFENSVNTIKVN